MLLLKCVSLFCNVIMKNSKRNFRLHINSFQSTLYICCLFLFLSFQNSIFVWYFSPSFGATYVGYVSTEISVVSCFIFLPFEHWPFLRRWPIAGPIYSMYSNWKYFCSKWQMEKMAFKVSNRIFPNLNPNLTKSVAFKSCQTFTCIEKTKKSELETGNLS